MNRRLSILFATLCFALCSHKLAAADVHLPEIEATILQGWTQADGSQISALKLTLSRGWKTYWRAAGEGGIPPQMDWTASTNLLEQKSIWPVPKVFVDFGLTSYGYEDGLLLPMVLKPEVEGKDIDLRGELLIGVCREICIPVELEVSAKIDTSKTAIVSEIAAALAERSYSAVEGQVSSVECQISRSLDGLDVNALIEMPIAGSPEHAVVETNNPKLWVQEAQVVREGALLTIASEVMHFEAQPFSLLSDDLTITIIGSNYAVEIQGCRTQ